MDLLDKVDSTMLSRIFADNDCGDGAECPMPSSVFPASTPPAMAYVPFQQWETPYEAEVGLSRGTVFPSLDKPFIGEEAVKKCLY